MWLICQIRVIPTIKTLKCYPLNKNRQLQTPCLGKSPGPDNEVILTCFDIFDIFVCLNVYRCNDICRGKTNSRTISEPPKNNSGLYTGFMVIMISSSRLVEKNPEYSRRTLIPWCVNQLLNHVGV
jgi:hypothetical protein